MGGFTVFPVKFQGNRLVDLEVNQQVHYFA